MTLFLLAVALSMDSFAAALSQGAVARPWPSPAAALRVGVVFGATQAVMPLLGWTLGVAFASTIREFDHWIAFFLLVLIGGNMLYSARTAKDRSADAHVPLASGWALFGTAVATSVDAAAAGVPLYALDQGILLACVVIGAITLVLVTAGVLLGRIAGPLDGRRAQMLGAFVLIGIGMKILIEHLFFGK